MKTRLVRCLLALVALGFWTGRGSCDAAEGQKKELPRFHEVAPGIYRGGQPKPGGFDLLKQKGVKTIINLRNEHDERQQVEALGFKYVYLPMDVRDEISAGDIATFLQTVTDPAQQPVFIHCQRGADRTGLMVGLYRVAKQGWSAEQAYREARKIGMRWWWRGLKRQLFEYAGKLSEAEGGSHGK